MRSWAIKAAVALWLPVGIIVAWWVLSADSHSPLYPSLQEIVDTLRHEVVSGEIGPNLVYSLVNLLIALGIAVVLGIAAGMAIGARRTTDEAFAPLLNFARSMPIVALVPLLVLAIGIGRTPKIVLIVLGCVWPILLNTIDGMRGVDPALRDLARSYRLPRWLRIRTVVLPAIGPQVAAGIRLAISIGLLMTVVSEMYAATRGIGYYILQSGDNFRVPETWAGSIVLGVLGYVMNGGFSLFERRFFKWHAVNAGRE